MSTNTILHADGSAYADAHERILVDRDDEPYRWVCPNGHSSWDATNSHIWCLNCRRQLETGNLEVDRAEHWELFDKKEKRTVPYAAVEVVEE